MIRRFCFFTLFSILICQVPGYAKGAEPPSASSAATMLRAHLVGSWVLVKHGHFDRSGQYHSTGGQMRGELIYAPDGSMSVLIMMVPEPAQLSDIIAYSGTFSIDGNKVLHHIEVSANPKHKVNSTESRLVSFRDGDLVLKTEPNADGQWEIVWRPLPH